jgi:hypothetical protein
LAHLTSAQQHRATPNGFKLARHFQIIKKTVPGQNLLQECSQFGNVPLAVTQLMHEAVLCLRRGDAKMFVERFVRRLHAQVRIENQQRRDSFDNGLGVVARLGEFPLGGFQTLVAWDGFPGRTLLC